MFSSAGWISLVPTRKRSVTPRIGLDQKTLTILRTRRPEGFKLARCRPHGSLPPEECRTGETPPEVHRSRRTPRRQCQRRRSVLRSVRTLLGMVGEAREAVSAYTQVRLSEAPRQVRLPEKESLEASVRFLLSAAEIPIGFNQQPLEVTMFENKFAWTTSGGLSLSFHIPALSLSLLSVSSAVHHAVGHCFLFCLMVVPRTHTILRSTVRGKVGVQIEAFIFVVFVDVSTFRKCT